MILLGVILAAVGVLVLFFPRSESLNGVEVPCGSAAAATAFCASPDGARFFAVSLMVGGVIVGSTAAMWPQVRRSPEHRNSPEPWEAGWSDFGRENTAEQGGHDPAT
ncbi:MAG: hypothetical protein ACRYF3_14415 [Janthinobacterium lividum]